MEMKTLTVNGQTFSVTDSTAVHFTPQDLTTQQQAQVRKNMGILPAAFDPEKQITPGDIPGAHYYTTFAGAVQDLNAGTPGATADAAAQSPACALYVFPDGEICLILLSDVTLTASTEITQNATLRLNGYTLYYPDAYKLIFSDTVEKCTVDGQVPGSTLFASLPAAAENFVMLRLDGVQSSVVGVTVDVAVESANANVIAIACTGKSAKIADCHIVNFVNEGAKSVVGIQYQSGCHLTVHNTAICVSKVGSDVGAAVGINGTSTAGELLVDRCRITTQTAGLGYGITSASDAIRAIQRTIVKVLPYKENGGSFWGVYNPNGVTNLHDCNIYVCPGHTEGSGVTAMANNADLSAENCTFFADGYTGATSGVCGVGVSTHGNTTLKNCTVYGTHSGIQCNAGSTTLIDGGVYEGVGHGGAYLANVDGNFYAQNATFKAERYRGKFKDQFGYGQYLVAAVYVGGGAENNNIQAYFDNCLIDGNGPALVPDGDALIGAEPIRFRAGEGEMNNSVYLSNCTLQGDGKVRFCNTTHKLYLGFGNRVLTEFSIPGCVDSTTYAGKVFSNYGEA